MWPLVLAGLMGSLHCVGMCSGFVLAIDRPGRALLRRVGVQALFHLGKTTTYVLLGGLAGLGGSALLRSGWFSSAQALLGVLAGVFLVLAGLQIGGWLKEWPIGSLFGPGSVYDRTFKQAMNLRSAYAPYVTGTLTGFLPCPLVYAFLAHALGAGSILPAMGTMAILGLTSLPALALVALLGARIRLRRALMLKIAAVLLIVLGVLTLARAFGLDWLHAILPGGHGPHHDHAHHGAS